MFALTSFFKQWEVLKQLGGVAPLIAEPFIDKAPPIGKIHTFRKITITLEPVMQFGCLDFLGWDMKFVTGTTGMPV